MKNDTVIISIVGIVGFIAIAGLIAQTDWFSFNSNEFNSPTENLAGRAGEVLAAVQCPPVAGISDAGNDPHKLYAKDSNDCPVGWFADDGNVVIRGSVRQNVAADLRSADAALESNSALIIENNGRVVFAITLAGDMLLSGTLTENQQTLTSSESAKDFRVFDNTNKLVSVVTESGSLFLAKRVTAGNTAGPAPTLPPGINETINFTFSTTKSSYTVGENILLTAPQTTAAQGITGMAVGVGEGGSSAGLENLIIERDTTKPNNVKNTGFSASPLLHSSFAQVNPESTILSDSDSNSLTPISALPPQTIETSKQPETSADTLGESGSVEFIKPQGYIIELLDEPLIQKKEELLTIAQKNSEGIRGATFSVSSVILPKSLEPVLPSNIDYKLSEYKNKLEEEQNDVLQSIKNAVGNSNLITGNAVATSSQDTEVESFTVTFNGFTLENIDAADAAKIESMSSVKSVYPNLPVHSLLQEAVPLIKADYAQNLGYTGKGVKIAILDTGVDYTHPDLGGCFGNGCKVVGGYDFANADNDPMDDQGHGTHVAATAAGKGILNGVAPDATIYAYKVLSSGGSGYYTDIIAAIERSVDPNHDGILDDKVDVISMSLGGPGNPDDPLSKAVDNAVEAGVSVVVAAGNSGPSSETVGSPGMAKRSLTVGATFDKPYTGKFFSADCFNENPDQNKVACFSSRGPVWGSSTKPDVVAPGVETCAAQWDTAFGIDQNYNNSYRPDVHRCVDSKHITISGTSMATPIVSGAVAIMKQKFPSWTPDEIKYTLKGTADNLGLEPTIQGAGRINLQRALSISSPYPVAAIINPGYSYDIAQIKGTASGRNFMKYTLDYHTPTNQNWILAGESTTPVSDGVLGLIGFSGISDSEVTVRLRVYDRFGQISSEISTFSLTNLYISSPLSRKSISSYTSDILRIKGTAYDNINRNIRLIDYTLSYKDYYNDSDSWHLIKTWGNPVVDGELGSWDTASVPQEKIYQIKLDGRYRINSVTQSYSDSVYVAVDNAYISSPNYWATFPLTIKGTAAGGHFINYVIGYARDDNLEQFVPVITSNTKVIDGVLGTIDGSTLADEHYYKITLQVNYDNQPPKTDVIWAYKGNKFTRKSTAGFFVEIGVSPLIADVDSDYSGKETLESSGDIFNPVSKIIAYHGDKTIMNGWPITISSEDSPVAYGVLNPLTTDFENNGAIEIIIPVRDKVYAFDKNAQLLPGWPFDTFHTYNENWNNWSQFPWIYEYERLYSDLSIGDINGDGHKEVIFTTAIRRGDGINITPTGSLSTTVRLLSSHRGSKIHVVDQNGDELSGFPVSVQEFVDVTPAITDLDFDGKQEIIVGTGYQSWGAESEQNYLIIFDSTGNIKLRKPFDANYFISKSPVVGDLDADGSPEIILAISNTPSIAALPINSSVEETSQSKILIFDVSGNLKYSVQVQGSKLSPIAIGNLDADNQLELAVQSTYNRNPFYRTVKQKLYVFNHDLTPLTGWPKEYAKYQEASSSSPIIGNIDSDAQNEILLQSGIYDSDGADLIYAFNHDGSIVQGWPRALGGLFFKYGIGAITPSIEDIDGDGRSEVVSGSWNADVYAWNTEGIFEEKQNDWPMLYHDPQHTNAYPKNLVPKEPIKPNPNVEENITTIGTQKVAVILVKTKEIDSQTLPTREEIYNRIFNGIPQTFYKEVSYGKMWFGGNVNPSITETNYKDVYGWYDIDSTDFRVGINGDSDSPEYDKAVAERVALAFDKIANQDPNFDLRKYPRFVIITPTGNGGFAWFGGMEFKTNSFGTLKKGGSIVPLYNMDWERFEDTFIHEFGHQLGVAEANGLECGDKSLGDDCTTITYANHFDVMGGHGKTPLHFSGYNKEFFGWIGTPDRSVIDVKQSGSYKLKPLESNGVVVAKIQSRDKRYYLEYRKPTGFDSVLGDDKIKDKPNIKKKNLGGIIITYPYDTKYTQQLYTNIIDMNPNDENKEYCNPESQYYPTYCQDWDYVALMPQKTFSDGFVEIKNIGEDTTNNELEFSVTFIKANPPQNPLPSRVSKSNTQQMNGHLTLKIEKKVSGQWQPVSTPLDRNIALGPNDKILDIAALWNQNPQKIQQAGAYRIVGKVDAITLDGIPAGFNYQNVWEFSVG